MENITMPTTAHVTSFDTHTTTVLIHMGLNSLGRHHGYTARPQDPDYAHHPAYLNGYAAGATMRDSFYATSKSDFLA